MIKTYLATSKEFQPIIVLKTANGTTTTVTSNIQYVAVPSGTPLSEGALQNPVVLDGEVGFFTDTLTVGYWDIGARIISNPEEPFILCGRIRIKE